MKEPDDYAIFWNRHQEVCTSNFKGSSQSMESSAAVEMWKRSVQKNKLIYETYIGDGDSSSFKNLLKSNPYNSLLKIHKEECLGHVQKRVKKWLRKKNKYFRGLPEAKADRIARMYALVVVQNRGKSATEIHEALQTLITHIDEKHHTCPVGEDTWCYFQKKLALTPSSSHIIPSEEYVSA